MGHLLEIFAHVVNLVGVVLDCQLVEGDADFFGAGVCLHAQDLPGSDQGGSGLRRRLPRLFLPSFGVLSPLVFFFSLCPGLSAVGFRHPCFRAREGSLKQPLEPASAVSVVVVMFKEIAPALLVGFIPAHGLEEILGLANEASKKVVQPARPGVG